MKVSENEIYGLALQRYGVEKQMIKCIEELSELQKELCKLSLCQGSLEHTTEEIADVEIMLEQMKIGLNIGFYDLAEVKNKKLCRLSERLGLLSEKEENKLQNEIKCPQCLYSFMTEGELAKSGGDPCDTCGTDLCNWKSKEEKVDPSWLVCENCNNQPHPGTDIPEKCELCEDDDRGRPSNFRRRM